MRNGPRDLIAETFFVTDTLKSKVRSVSVNTATNASDHQPILMDLRA